MVDFDGESRQLQKIIRIGIILLAACLETSFVSSKTVQNFEAQSLRLTSPGPEVRHYHLLHEKPAQRVAPR